MANELVQSLGWIVRRTPAEPIQAAKFYENALGMRSVRPPPVGVAPNKMLWTGDIVMFELSARTATPEGDARIGDLVPVLRARDFDTARKNILAGGGKLVDETPGQPRFAQFADPAGYPFAIVAPPTASPFPSDRLADQTWAAGGIALPDIPKFGPALQDMASIILKVEDPVAMARFYQTALGLEPVGPANPAGAVLYPGRTSTIVLRAGGVKRPLPKDRAEIPDVWILRVRDIEAMRARLAVNNVMVINEMTISGGKLIYALDPEGHLFGVQQRSPAFIPPGMAERVEDALARSL